MSDEFSTYCEENEIHRELTAPYSPLQNGIAERKNRTIVEMGRSMMKARGVPKQFWGEAVATTVYLLNISPTKAVLNQTPFEAWKGYKPKVSHLRIFGCVSYALVNSYRLKLDEKSQKCTFLGYSTQSKAYKLYNPVSGKVIVSRNVRFNEAGSWSWEYDTNKDTSELKIPEDDVSEIEDAVADTSPPSSPSGSSNSSPVHDSTPSSNSETPPRKFKSLQEVYESCSFALYVQEPTCFEEAINNEAWKNAMMEEMTAIEHNHTWDLVDLPEGKTPIGLKWVFKVKHHADGTIQKYKARLVAKGYAQH